MSIKARVERLIARTAPPGDTTIWCYVGYAGPECRRVPGPQNVYHLFLPVCPAELPRGLMLVIEPGRPTPPDDPVVPLLAYALVCEAATARQRHMLAAARTVVVLLSLIHI